MSLSRASNGYNGPMLHWVEVVFCLYSLAADVSAVIDIDERIYLFVARACQPKDFLGKSPAAEDADLMSWGLYGVIYPAWLYGIGHNHSSMIALTLFASVSWLTIVSAL